jgi:hypothetical protein
MNNQQLYLAWLRTNAPAVYVQAVRKATGKARNLGGLGDDLLQQAMSPNLSTFLGDDISSMDFTSADFQAPDMAPISIAPPDISIPGFDPGSVDAPAPVTISSGGATGLPVPTPSNPAPTGSTFSNILTAVTTIGIGIIGATNQSKLVAINTQRARQGLPPVDSTGRVITPAGFSTTSPTLLAFERSISGAMGGGMLPIIAVLGIGAFFFFRKKA